MDDLSQAPMKNRMPGTAFGNAIIENFFIAEEIDLNKVLEAALTKQANKSFLSIHRSDKLPLINGNKEKIVQMFDAISAMIINHPPLNSKLFLYVKCEIEQLNPEALNLHLLANGFIYTLFFHTNITTDENWRMVYQDQLATCAVIAAENNGSFSFHPISNTGCLFSLTLPGKN